MTTPPPGSREAAQALEKLATDLSDIILLCDYSNDVSRKQTTYARDALSLLPTLRAALAPPADGAGEVEDFLDYVRDTLDDVPPLGGCTFCGHDPYHRTEFGEPVGIVCCEPRSWLIQDNEEDEEIREAVSKLIGSRNQQHTALGTALKRYENLLHLLSEERARRVEWQPMETAPRDGQYILAIVGKNDSQHMAHLEGRVFSIRPEPFGTGWSVYPGYGGAPSEWFTCWQPLPAPPATHKDTQDD